jgi:REP element-mobilizing transposase RayT
MNLADTPIAYHMTFGTYGARLHGDPRPTVDRDHNQFGTPFVATNFERRSREATLMRAERVVLTETQRLFVESVIPTVCGRGQWTYHITAAQCDHVHTLLTADGDARAVRRLLKRWLSEELDRRWPRARGQVWWAEGGSIKWIWKEDYLRDAYEYIERQRSTRE